MHSRKVQRGDNLFISSPLSLCNVQVKKANFWIISALETSTLLKIPPYNMKRHEVPFVNTSETTEKVERPKRERQMYK